MRLFFILLLALSQSANTAPFVCDDTLYIMLNEPDKSGSVLNNIAAYTISISECPEDFTTHLNQTRCYNQGSETTIKWTTDSSIQ